ncbi:Na(+)/dicarboxylate symporter [Hartmannibacter diazotrophicus]|uniref:Na(+)/dicarboxylate symporter n=1 Tax=Hartmannibacter diazotrophicus TaxID=1482074 RepID=A0A2C9D202_9HYPH|nr:SLC13 family permease [Hartmannibacter diazotrophicus]SON53831.1 Na(+)/dicarboxylate symporter [Hartmannibacter diazotrophicus]
MASERNDDLVPTAEFGALKTLANLVGFGVAAASLVIPPQAGLSAPAQAAAGIGFMMAVFWVTELIPIAVTALIPLVLFPPSGIASIEDLASSYANPVIFLFLGGFLIARAIEQWGLHRRLAHSILARTRGDPSHIILSMMLVTAFLSLWISNTASAMVTAPIAASIAAMSEDKKGFAPALMLGVAYAATIGGVGSLIGTPPNAIFAGYMEEAHGVTIGFADWMLVGLPVVAVLLPLTWLFLTRVSFRIAAGEVSIDLESLGPMSAPELRVAVVAGLTALGWILRPAVSMLFPDLDFSDAGVAMTGALALFLIPAGSLRGARLLEWKTASSLRWDVLILFGGGLSLASAIDSTGLASWIGESAQKLHGLPTVWVLLVFALIIVYLGELASNTAMAAIFMPIAGAAAVGMGNDPLVFALPVALAASMGFMLPIATPPNAIVFANPAVTRSAMLKAGAPLNLIGVAVALAAGMWLGPIVF